jgi:hypothetical protein
MLMVNVLCKTKKVRIFQLEMVLSSRSKDTVRNSPLFNYSLVRRYHGVYERNLQTLSEIHTRL